jgi:hypothetical protein
LRLFLKLHFVSLMSGLILACETDGRKPCVTPSCTAPTHVVVRWSFERHLDLGFDGDSCADVDASMIRFVASDDYETVFDTTVPCTDGMLTVDGLLPGVGYQGNLFVHDAAGTDMLRSPVSMEVTSGTPNPVYPVFDFAVDWDEWSVGRVGTFSFQTLWGGLACGAAMPAVTDQVFNLSVAGQAAGAATQDGQQLDGVDQRPCLDTVQTAESVPTGPGTFSVTGKDSSGAVLYEKDFPVFIGAGPNPSETYDAR